jgi:hypothetical protein
VAARPKVARVFDGGSGRELLPADGALDPGYLAAVPVLVCAKVGASGRPLSTAVGRHRWTLPTQRSGVVLHRHRLSFAGTPYTKQRGARRDESPALGRAKSGGWAAAAALASEHAAAAAEKGLELGPEPEPEPEPEPAGGVLGPLERAARAAEIELPAALPPLALSHGGLVARDEGGGVIFMKAALFH